MTTIYRLKPIVQIPEEVIVNGVHKTPSNPMIIPFTLYSLEKAQEIMSKFPPGTYELVTEEK